MLFLSESDVESSLEPKALVAALAQAFVALAQGRAANPHETRIDDHEQRANFVAFPAYAPAFGSYAVKVLSGHHGNPGRGLPFIHAVVVLIDPSDGRIVAVMAARGLTAIRTAATSALATQLLARPGSSHLAVIGAGVQARAHLMLLPRVIDVTQITVCSSSGAIDRAARLADEVGAALGRQVRTAAEIAVAVAAADIVVTCTHAPTPLFRPEALSPHAHLNVVGGFRPGDTEVDPLLLIRAARIVADDRERLTRFWQDAPAGLSPGVLDRIEGLPECIASPEATAAPSGPTVFLSHGLAIEDAVAARLAFDAATKKGLGQRLAT